MSTGLAAWICGVARRLLEDAAQAGVDAVLDAAGLAAARGAGPIHHGPVHPASVVGEVRIGLVAVIVGEADLVAHVDERNAAEAGDQRVTHEDAVDGGVDRRGIAGGDGRFESAERGAAAIAAPVAGSGIGLEVAAAGEAAGKASGIELGEEVAVRRARDADGRCILIGDGPADVVMAAQIGSPGRVDEDARKMGPQHMGHQPGLARRQRRPELHHERIVIGEVALAPRVPALAEIGDEVLRRHDGLFLVDQRRRHDPAGGAQGLEQLMHFGLVLAACAHPLPHEGHGIETDNLDTPVGEEEHDLHDLEEDLRVGPVEIPLMLVEGGPDPFAHVGVEGEVAGRMGGEDLDQRARIGLGQRRVVEDPVIVTIGRVASPRLRRPGMFLRRVVQHEVDADRHAALPQRCGHGREIVHAAERRVDGPVVHHRVAAVTVARTRLEAGHEVDIGDAQLFEIVQPVEHAAKRAIEAVDVEDVAHHLLAQEPVGFEIAAQVQRLKAGGPFFLCCDQRGDQLPAEAPIFRM